MEREQLLEELCYHVQQPDRMSCPGMILLTFITVCDNASLD